MKRGIAVLTCVCVLTAAVYFGISKWGIRHETLNLFDTARQRPVAVDLAVRWDYEMKANDGYWKLPVAVISNGNTVKNTEYSFLANVTGRKGLSGCQHSAGPSDRSAIDDQDRIAIRRPDGGL